MTLHRGRESSLHNGCHNCSRWSLYIQDSVWKGLQANTRHKSGDSVCTYCYKWSMTSYIKWNIFICVKCILMCILSFGCSVIVFVAISIYKQGEWTNVSIIRTTMYFEFTKLFYMYCWQLIHLCFVSIFVVFLIVYQTLVCHLSIFNARYQYEYWERLSVVNSVRSKLSLLILWL